MELHPCGEHRICRCSRRGVACPLISLRFSLPAILSLTKRRNHQSNRDCNASPGAARRGAAAATVEIVRRLSCLCRHSGVRNTLLTDHTIDVRHKRSRRSIFASVSHRSSRVEDLVATTRRARPRPALARQRTLGSRRIPFTILRRGRFARSGVAKKAKGQ